MHTDTRRARQNLIDEPRMVEAAITAGRSAEALLGYLSRLDALRDVDLDPKALADRAAEAELHTRAVLHAGLDALNELNDLGLLSNEPTDEELEIFNQTTLQEALKQIAETFHQRIPGQNWDWLDSAGRLLEGVQVRLERCEEGLCGTVTHCGQSSVVRFDPRARPTRVSTSAFFSDGPDRIYIPTSAVFSLIEDSPVVVAPYDAIVRRMAFTREWVYRHARDAAELGPPARSGGGPVIAVIIIVLAVASAIAAVAVSILSIACAAGSDGACRLAAYFGLAASVMGGSAEYLDHHSGQPRVLSYGTNLQ